MPTLKPTPVKLPPPNPAMDSISHINVHYKDSKTKLGRMLSTYFVARFHHPYFGPFKCIEGFMLFVRTGCQDDAFRHMNGADAKRYYREQCRTRQLQKHEIPNEKEILLHALFAQLQQHSVIATLFTESSLPFDAYYFYGDGKVPIRQGNAAVLIAALTELRDHMKQHQTPPPLPPEQYEQLRKV